MFDIIEFSLLIDISYHNFFIHTDRRRAKDLGVIGYQLIEEDDWALDFIYKNYVLGYDPASIERYQDHPLTALKDLDERNHGAGTAIRYTKYDDNVLFTLDLAKLFLDNNNNNILLESYYSYRQPYRNWDIYFGGGITYYSADIISYYYGVAEHEANNDRQVYRPGAGFKLEFEVFAQYPLSQSWYLNTGITQIIFSKNISDSPLVRTNNLTQVRLGLRYVF